MWILVCFIVYDFSFFLICSLLSLIVVHYARDCSCTCILYNEHVHVCECGKCMVFHRYMYRVEMHTCQSLLFILVFACIYLYC